MRGSVYRRCTLCARRPGREDHDSECRGRQSTWYFRVDVGRDQAGRRREIKRGGFTTKREAERSLREVLGRVDSSTYVERSVRTINDYLTVDWLPTQRPPKVSPNRYRNIRNAVVKHVIPAIGGLSLQQLNAAHLDRFYAALLRKRPAGDDDSGTRPLAPSTVVQIHGVVRKALRDAVKWGLVETNVATLAEPPSNAAVKASRQQAIRIWTPDELSLFLERSREDWLYPMWLLAATTGLRRGELAGIVDGSLDLETARLVVEWQLVPEEQFDQPGVTIPVHKPVMKSNAGSRTIDLDSHTTKAIHLWLQRRQTWATELAWPRIDSNQHEACRIGHGRSGHGRFLFCWPDGRHLNPDWVTHEFSRMCRDADVPTIRLHDVRHTHASLMLAGGEHLKVVQERLGWASSAFMIETYTHLMPGMQHDAAERFATDILDRHHHTQEDRE